MQLSTRRETQEQRTHWIGYQGACVYHHLGSTPVINYIHVSWTVFWAIYTVSNELCFTLLYTRVLNCVLNHCLKLWVYDGTSVLSDRYTHTLSTRVLKCVLKHCLELWIWCFFKPIHKCWFIYRYTHTLSTRVLNCVLKHCLELWIWCFFKPIHKWWFIYNTLIF